MKLKDILLKDGSNLFRNIDRKKLSSYNVEREKSTKNFNIVNVKL